jgi:hypothetical protein
MKPKVIQFEVSDEGQEALLRQLYASVREMTQLALAAPPGRWWMPASRWCGRVGRRSIGSCWSKRYSGGSRPPKKGASLRRCECGAGGSICTVLGRWC